MNEDIDVVFSETYDSWVCVTSFNTVTVFPDEDSACEFQRYWRELFGFDPVTGEPLQSVEQLC